MTLRGEASLNRIAHATHDGLKIEGSAEERLDRDIYLVGRAYDAIHEALWTCLLTDDRRALLDDAKAQVGRCLDELARERQAVQRGRSEHP